MTPFVFVMRGLDPRIHPLRKSLAKKMDRRIKSGDDAWRLATIIAAQTT